MKNILERLQQTAGKLSYRNWLVVAGAISVMLGVMVYFSLQTEENKPVAQTTQTVYEEIEVVVAKTDIAPRTVIRPQMLEVKKLPKVAVPEDVLKELKDIINKPAATLIQKGEILTAKRVLTDAKQAGFTGMIPPDCRAISVGISDVTGVAGFAKAGDYVDVMVVKGRKEDGRLVGQFVLQNVLLLGINKNGAEEKKDEAKDAGNIKANRETMATATLALKPEDSLLLATTAQNGVIYLALRPYQPSEKIVPTKDYVLYTEQYGNRQNQTQAPRPGMSAPAPAAAPSGGGSVEVIRGTKVTREGGGR